MSRGKRLPNKPKKRVFHTLTNIDPFSRLAHCSTCGETQIVKRQGGGKLWACVTVRYKGLYNGAYAKHRKNYCENKNCPHDISHPCMLDVHHIDGDRKNNDPSNLLTLCSLCHRMITFKVAVLVNMGDYWVVNVITRDDLKDSG